jgi:CRISPR/Cas system-associated exonuclease Cas4 (RecB family)
MSNYTVKIADSMPAEPAMSQEYFNAKYKAWLRRRGFEQEASEMEQRAFLNRKRRGIQAAGTKSKEAKP